jgi:hypothetical protein
MKKLSFVFLLVVLSVYITGCSKTPDVENIKGDIIGKIVKLNSSQNYSFASLSDCKEIKIINQTQNGAIIEYNTEMQLNAPRGGTFTLKAKIVYRKEEGNWKLLSLEPIEYAPYFQ